MFLSSSFLLMSDFITDVFSLVKSVLLDISTIDLVKLFFVLLLLEALLHIFKGVKHCTFT